LFCFSLGHLFRGGYKSGSTHPREPPMAKKSLSKDASKKESGPTRKKSAPGPASVVVRVAEKVADVVAQAADVVQERVVQPLVAAATAKPKKARHVREKKEPTPEAKPAALPARSTKTSGKLMSKGMKVAPKAKPEKPGTKVKPGTK
jgi:hypothetical protein